MMWRNGVDPVDWQSTAHLDRPFSIQRAWDDLPSCLLCRDARSCSRRRRFRSSVGKPPQERIGTEERLSGRAVFLRCHRRKRGGDRWCGQGERRTQFVPGHGGGDAQDGAAAADRREGAVRRVRSVATIPEEEKIWHEVVCGGRSRVRLRLGHGGGGSRLWLWCDGEGMAWGGETAACSREAAGCFYRARGWEEGPGRELRRPLMVAGDCIQKWKGREGKETGDNGMERDDCGGID